MSVDFFSLFKNNLWLGVKTISDREWVRQTSSLHDTDHHSQMMHTATKKYRSSPVLIDSKCHNQYQYGRVSYHSQLGRKTSCNSCNVQTQLGGFNIWMWACMHCSQSWRPAQLCVCVIESLQVVVLACCFSSLYFACGSSVLTSSDVLCDQLTRPGCTCTSSGSASTTAHSLLIVRRKLPLFHHLRLPRKLTNQPTVYPHSCSEAAVVCCVHQQSNTCLNVQYVSSGIFSMCNCALLLYILLKSRSPTYKQTYNWHSVTLQTKVGWGNQIRVNFTLFWWQDKTL